VNTGEPSRDVKEGEQVGTKGPTNPPKPARGVRVAIVLGA
jgi:retron-type reverse transcriptase